MSICAETNGRFELDPEPSDPNGNCVLARLIQEGYNCSSLASADEKNSLSVDLLYRAVHTNADPAQVIDKMQPDCLKLAAIAQKRKFKIPETKENNVINKSGENAFSASFIHAEIGDSERLYREATPPAISQMDGYGKGFLTKC